MKYKMKKLFFLKIENKKIKDQIPTVNMMVEINQIKKVNKKNKKRMKMQRMKVKWIAHVAANATSVSVNKLTVAAVK